MIVEMLRDYHGQRAGNVVELGGGLAELLILRGFAKEHKPKQSRQPKQAGTTPRKRKNAKRTTAV